MDPGTRSLQLLAYPEHEVRVETVKVVVVVAIQRGGSVAEHDFELVAGVPHFWLAIGNANVAEHFPVLN